MQGGNRETDHASQKTKEEPPVSALFLLIYIFSVVGNTLVMIVIILDLLVLGFPLAFIVGGYCCIGYSLSKISTFRERVKAFKTCTGHLSLVAIYFLPIIFVYVFWPVIHPNARIINLSMTSVMPPMLNPIIYALQTQEIKESLRRLLKARVQAKLEVFRLKTL
ncbi:olfactory receptor 19-like [Neolamprologus brichardi]|uniref:olfactory receptor 19-like n=1 Tax=Neolamprologus brichardi TaxID=32507 RepID=UPI001643DB33|nr:olfactory receptor 19-like [Neolamprologus brichardi]